jgi:hypothetical protein
MKKIIPLIIAASAVFLAGCCSPHHMTKWEYKQIGGAQSEASLNKLGDDGWRVVGFSGTDTSARYVLARPKQ